MLMVSEEPGYIGNILIQAFHLFSAYAWVYSEKLILLSSEGEKKKKKSSQGR